MYKLEYARNTVLRNTAGNSLRWLRQRASCPPVEPNPALPRMVSSRSYEGVSLRSLWTSEGSAYFDNTNFRGADAFYDQLGDAIALLN